MIKRESLLSLERYARERDAFRAQVMEHKKQRTVHLGEHLTLHFEDELTMRYQVQEMLRVELDAAAQQRLKRGAALAIGVEHPAYQAVVDPVPPAVRDALLRDLN